MGNRAVALKVSPDRGPEPAIVGCLDHPRIMPAFSVCRDPAEGCVACACPIARACRFTPWPAGVGL